jgi:hypothetical protein
MEYIKEIHGEINPLRLTNENCLIKTRQRKRLAVILPPHPEDGQVVEVDNYGNGDLYLSGKFERTSCKPKQYEVHTFIYHSKGRQWIHFLVMNEHPLVSYLEYTLRNINLKTRIHEN